MTTIGARSGILLVDKPAGITSHDVVSRTRKLAGTRKVGHAGTLDPMATGLLVLGLNASTRLLTWVVGLDKEYSATIRLGASTTTDDREGDVLETAPAGTVQEISGSVLAAEIARLTGAIEQVPSSVSAIKVDGRRAYALVREGQEVELKSRAVTVAEFVVTDRRLADDRFIDLDVRVVCSTGTYIRALARDLGKALGVGGHLTALRRTRIGPFRVSDAATLESLNPSEALIGPATAAAALFPVVDLDERQTLELGQGKRLVLDDAPDGEPVAAIAPDGRLIGLVTILDGRARTLVNFPPDSAPPIPQDSASPAPPNTAAETEPDSGPDSSVDRGRGSSRTSSQNSSAGQGTP